MVHVQRCGPCSTISCLTLIRPSSQLIDALALLLPSSPTYALLTSLPAAEPTKPLASPYHAIQLALRSPLAPLLELVSLAEAEESQLIEAEIKKRRQRLGGQTLSASETRRAVEGEFMRSSRLPNLYRAVLDEPDASADEELRRGVERKLLLHLRTLLNALPSSYDETSLDLRKGEKKQEVREEEDRLKALVRGDVEELARGMVLIGVPDESAWIVGIEWKDRYGDWSKVDWRELERYSTLFPESVVPTASLSKIVADPRSTALDLPRSPLPAISVCLLLSPWKRTRSRSRRRTTTRWPPWSRFVARKLCKQHALTHTRHAERTSHFARLHHRPPSRGPLLRRAEGVGRCRSSRRGGRERAKQVRVGNWSCASHVSPDFSRSVPLCPAESPAISKARAERSNPTSPSVSSISSHQSITCALSVSSKSSSPPPQHPLPPSSSPKPTSSNRPRNGSPPSRCGTKSSPPRCKSRTRAMRH